MALTPSASSVMEWPGLAWGGASLDRCVLLVLLTAEGRSCPGGRLSPEKPGGLEPERLPGEESL